MGRTEARFRGPRLEPEVRSAPLVIKVPGIGDSTVVLPEWLKAERVVDDGIISVTYFRIRIPSGGYWRHQRSGENKIPANPIIQYG